MTGRRVLHLAKRTGAMFLALLALLLIPETAAAAAPADEQQAMAERLFEEGRALEAEGRFSEALRPYRLAARNGHGKAAKRLGQLYYGAVPAVEPNYAESLKWYNAARVMGEAVPMRRFR